MTHDLQMPGDYEFKALHKGNTVQQQWNRNRILLLKHIKFITKGDVVLDAGCGSGNAVLEFYKNAKQMDGWDINPNSIRFLKEMLRRKNIKNVSVSVKDLLKFSGKPKYSKIILTEVIEHFAHRDYVKMLKNLNSVMKKDGEIFITTPNDKSLWPVLDFSLNLVQKYVQRIPTFHDRHLGHFDKKKLVEDVEKAGFKVVRSGTMNAFSPFLFFTDNKTRDRISIWEALNVSFGPLLYVIAEKK